MTPHHGPTLQGYVSSPHHGPTLQGYDSSPHHGPTLQGYDLSPHHGPTLQGYDLSPHNGPTLQGCYEQGLYLRTINILSCGDPPPGHSQSAPVYRIGAPAKGYIIDKCGCNFHVPHRNSFTSIT